MTITDWTTSGHGAKVDGRPCINNRSRKPCASTRDGQLAWPVAMKGQSVKGSGACGIVCGVVMRYAAQSLVSDLGTGENLSPFKGRKRSCENFFLPLKVKIYGRKDGPPVK